MKAMRSQSSPLESSIILSAWLLTLAAMSLFAAQSHLQTPLQNISELWMRNKPQNWVWAFSLLPINLVAVLNVKGTKWFRATIVGSILVPILAYAIAQGQLGPRAAVYIAIKADALFGLLALLFQVRLPRSFEHWLMCIMFMTYLAMDAFSLNQTYAVRPQTLDEFTYAFDAALDFNPAWHLFHQFNVHRPFAALCNVTYDVIMAAPFALYAIQIRFSDDRTVPALRAFLTAAVLGMLCYMAFPVSGPLFFFGQNTYLAHPTASITPRILLFHDSWRNGMPSLHLAFALLVAINVPATLRWIRRGFFAFALGTAIAALANGQHYFVDMIAALPFVCAVQSLSLYIGEPRNFELLKRFAVSVAVISAFFMFLLFAPAWLRTPMCAWIVCLAVGLYASREIATLRNLLRHDVAPLQSRNDIGTESVTATVRIRETGDTVIPQRVS